MGPIAVFAYGSLVDEASAAETLGRPVAGSPMARLEGWSRRWTLARDNRACEKTFARPDGSLPSFCLGLNLEADPATPAPNGALIELSEGELERLDLREIRYCRVDVSAAITLDSGEPHAFERIVAYRARAEHHRPEAPADAIVIASYPRTIEAAFAGRGPEQLARFRQTTAPIPVEVVEAELVAERIPPGNPRAW